MPGGDGTGPLGYGSMTGRAAGYCSGYEMPGFANTQIGRFRGRGLGGGNSFGGSFGRGRGFRHIHNATGLPGWMRGSKTSFGNVPIGFGVNSHISKDDEIQSLKEQAEYFKKAADDINARLIELEKNDI